MKTDRWLELQREVYWYLKDQSNRLRIITAVCDAVEGWLDELLSDRG